MAGCVLPAGGRPRCAERCAGCGAARGAALSAGWDSRGAVRAAVLRGVRLAGCAGAVRGVRCGALRGMQRRAMRGMRCGARPQLGARGTRPLAGAGRGHGGGGCGVVCVGFPAGWPGTISAGGCVSRGRAPLAERCAALPAPALNPAVPAGERESGGEEGEMKTKTRGEGLLGCPGKSPGSSLARPEVKPTLKVLILMGFIQLRDQARAEENI